MCGIIGYTGGQDAIPIVLDGLKRLEYRGYDSAGVAYHEEGEIRVIRCKGKIKDLAALFKAGKHESRSAIGHTRWATHGKPSEENAHPHRSGGIVVVHNGIIENYMPLKRQLEAEGFSFASETDTEIISHLINKHLNGVPLEEAVRLALSDVRGAYAIAVMSDSEPEKLIGVRKDSPLVVGVGDGESFLASDVPAFLSHTRDVIFLDDGEMVVAEGGAEGGIKILNMRGETVDKPVVKIPWDSSMAEKGGYRHFMLKEINEQPRAIADTISGRLKHGASSVNLMEFGINEAELKAARTVHIAACGTSWHAALTAKYMIEELARIPVQVDIASEFRYRNPILAPGDLFVCITQSGETADTLAAGREAKRLGARVLCICNVIGSTAAREADSVFYTRSGPEIGVASTKAFTTQIVSLYLLAVAMGEARGTLSRERTAELLAELLTIPEKVEDILNKGKAAVEALAREFFKKRDFLYLGRGINYPIALEGALKLKEISYIHAEAYPAGEMKHGPIALIDEELPVLFVAPRDKLYEKIISSIHEVKSRGGTIISVLSEGDTEVKGLSDHSMEVPISNHLLDPLLFTVPLQLLAYHIGVLRGCDVDQPRNLAKSVTVE